VLLNRLWFNILRSALLRDVLLSIALLKGRLLL
jgi:hypothetical protein